ncbi:hypothetical protein ACFT30_08565 [Microbacterium ureisolvens]|uniref:hypothetical protein n=1 Tax=Microbacterium TaxID=33882 RepID=UPI000D659699|nr:MULTISPECIES: hypothetical protein [Microbacterium]
MDGSTLTFTADRLDRERAAALDRENEILRSVADRGVTISPESPTAHVAAGVGVWFRHLFTRPRQARFA